MSYLQNLITKMKLERLDTLLFRGHPNEWPNSHVFGGHVVAQAMEAANHTVDPSFKIHSLHCYFLRPGISGQAIIYDVDPIRDGRSFVTRRVVAIQNGEAIFNIAISYHSGEEGLSHQINMSKSVPKPEDLDDDEAYNAKLFEAYTKTAPVNLYMPFEMRSIDRLDPINPMPKDPVTGGYWFRLKEKIGDDQNLHSQLLAYISDFAFLSSSLRPHAMTPLDPKLKTVASLDHTMWYHEDNFRVDEWIYYQTEGYWSGHGRGLARGALYAANGTLLASTSQECLLRLKK
ncbi:acyl-CoA thioesterase [Kordiimonas pumila]|uniref:Acyl-CoA thioesterase n=1 Tax=Kordiimonas pumila TaxID=2161677 RepID=A0ABV7D2B3_9PROT|nr:acyl-CoA thioesterase II [Kordiimonas pumila]